jgi:hypothetical protein
MSLGWTVVLVNFGIIVVVYICGRLIDAAAERYDSRPSTGSGRPELVEGRKD